MLRENVAENLWENVAGKCCRKLLQENGNCNRVMGSQPISIQREIVAGKSCGKLLQEILVGNGGGEKANLRKTVIGGNLAFGIG